MNRKENVQIDEEIHKNAQKSRQNKETNSYEYINRNGYVEMNKDRNQNKPTNTKK